MSMTQRNVFFYWRGNDYKLISLLRKLFYAYSNVGKGYNLVFLNDVNIHEYVKNIPKFVYKMPPAIIADYLRVMVLCDYGGIWIDSDTVVMESLDSLFELLENQQGFFIKENNTILWNGIFGTVKNTPLMLEWKKRIEEKVKKQRHKIRWGEIGNRMLNSMYEENSSLYEGYKIFEGLDNVYPVNWDNCVEEFINKPYENYKNIVRDYQPVVVLVNSVYKELENSCVSTEQLLELNIPLNYFIHKSILNLGMTVDDFIRNN